jgi:hypothetical protein
MTAANKIGRMRISVPPPTYLRTAVPALAFVSLPGRRNVSSSARRWQGSTTADTATNPDAGVNAGAGAAGARVENTSSPSAPPSSPSKQAEKANAKNGKGNGKEEKTELEKMREEKEDVVVRFFSSIPLVAFWTDWVCCCVYLGTAKIPPSGPFERPEDRCT